jgi:hypothetical protein
MTNTTKIRTLDNFLELLPGYKDIAKGNYQANCPGHNDKDHQLYISYKSRKLLLSCHKGCITENIVSAMGLTMDDLSLNSGGFGEPDADWDRSRDTKVINELAGKPEDVRQPVVEQQSAKEQGDAEIKPNAGSTEKKHKTRADTCPVSTPTKRSDITLRRMDLVKAEHVTWLWKPYIGIGKLTLLEGDPGIGKSWVTLAIATAISLGKGLPGHSTIEPGIVILASAEDGLGDTIRPRLDAMKAEVDRIFAIDGAVSFDDAGFTLIESYIIEVKPRLLIIDPLVAYLAAGMDFHRANETRPIMARLAKLAEKYQLAILAVRHLAKGGMNKAIYRGIGSIDFTAACRSVLLAGCDADDADNLAIVHIKSNLAQKGPSQGYQLRDDNFYWTGESTLTSTQILAGDDSSGVVSELEEAITFLKDELAGGPVPAKDVYHTAESIGIKARTLERAKSQVCAKTFRKGENGRRGGGEWCWALPPDDLHRQDGDLNNAGVGNINIATIISGDLNNSVAKKSTSPKMLATLIREKIVPVDTPPEPPWTPEDDQPPDDDDAPSMCNEPPGLVAPAEDIIKRWNRAGCPGDWMGDGTTDNVLLPELLRDEDTSTRIVDAANKWYIQNKGNKVVQANE